MAEFDDISDPYVRCAEKLDENGMEIPGSGHCNHDLARGLTIEQALGPDDGEYGVWNPLLIDGELPPLNPSASLNSPNPVRPGLILPESYRRNVGRNG